MHESLPRPPAAPAAPLSASRVLSGLVLFGIAFGYVEAAAAIYLRGQYAPIHHRVFPGRPSNDLFPLIPLDRLEAEDEQGMRWLAIELGREAATLVMLVAVALCVGRNFRQAFAAFVLAFGTWDIFYYVFLKVWLDWPDSLFTWDLLFLLPVPWAGPVLAPVLVAVAMIGAGAVVLYREAAGRPVHLGWPHWLGLVTGGFLIVASFCEDYPGLLAGQKPGRFPWEVFFLGTAVGLAAFGVACRERRSNEPP